MNFHAMNLPAGFQFVDDPATWTDSMARVVHLPRSLRGKKALLTEYVRQLSLPDYFGWNWDALDECLRDLHWLPDPRRIAIVHAGLPLGRHSHGRRTYVQLLRGAVAAWSANDAHELVVVFPARARDEIVGLLDVAS